MKHLSLAMCVFALAFSVGCANHIKYADTVIWDRVPDTDRVALDDQRIEGAVIKAKVRFVCQKRQYAVTNDYVTPYEAAHELYEVPTGLVTFPLSLAWWIVSKVISLGAAPADTAAGPLYWSTAGLNPLLNVENGMFVERYEIREKKGSRRPQEGSSPEPYDATLPPAGGTVKARFDGGEDVSVHVGDDLLLMINLIELARVMPGPDAQKILIDVTLQWNPQAEPVVKTVTVFIDKPLAGKLHELKTASATLMTTKDLAAFDQALEAVEKAGFSREAAMIRDKRKGDLPRPSVQKKP